MSQRERERLAMATRSDDEQRLAAERYRIVIESMGSMIFDYDFVKRSTFRSDAIGELFRWAEVDLTEEWWAARIHPDDVERVRGVVYPAIKHGQVDKWDVGYRFRRGDAS